MLEAPFAGPKVKGEYVRECAAATGSQGRTDNLLDGRRTLLSGHGLDARFGTDGSYASGRGEYLQQPAPWSIMSMRGDWPGLYHAEDALRRRISRCQKALWHRVWGLDDRLPIWEKTGQPLACPLDTHTHMHRSGGGGGLVAALRTQGRARRPVYSETRDS